MAYGTFADGATINMRAPKVSGGAEWVRSDTYDILAKAEGNVPFPQMAGPMLRALLESRFRLKVHREMQDVPAYLLTVSKTGPKLKASRQGSCIPFDLTDPPASQPGVDYCGTIFRFSPPVMTVTSRGGTLKQLADVLSRMVDRPILDKTGVAGQYDFQIKFDYAPDRGGAVYANAAEPSNGSDEAPSIFEILQSQLGLKLERGKGESVTVVIDYVERPTEN
jgi:uncharacterized protein (TIGR03435 family)